MVPALDYEHLWNKSKLFIDKALAARDEADDLTYHLWASVAIELLGKASLSKIHPALVADPSQFKSLLAACGKQTTPSVRSIQANTLYERLGNVFPEFDDRIARECQTMANRRNAELHSGESPMLGQDARSWVPVLWKVAAILLKTQNRDLSEWVGPTEAKRAEKILADSAETTTQAVLARIERRAAQFAAMNPTGSTKRSDAQQRAMVRPEPRTWSSDEAYDEVNCPACGLRAWVYGEAYDRDVVDRRTVQYSEDHFEYFQTINVYYSVESFACDECGLELEGQEEISIADLPTEFEQEQEEEPDYEPDYGND